VRFSFKLNVHGRPLNTSFETYLEEVRLAEQVGFHAVYVIDHLYLPSERLAGYTNANIGTPYFLDCWTTLAAIAASTTRIRLGPQMSPIGLRHPAFIAKWGATVDAISGGRLVLGLGLGHQEVEYKSFGFEYPSFSDRYRRMLEGVEIIDKLWTETGPVNFEGAYYRIEDVRFWPKPVQSPRPPFWFGGTSKAIRRAVARWGDGWAPAAPQAGGLDPDFYCESLRAIRDEAAALGRRQHIGAGALFYTAVSRKREDLHDVGEILRRRADWSALSDDELAATGTILMGTPDEAARAIDRYVTAGVEEFTISFVPLDDHDAIRRGLELYAEEILPRFT
jgi:probable F420-dependent oxidoreductase